MPSLAVSTGHMIGGGFFIFMAHDVGIIKNDPKLRMQLPELEIGNFPYGYLQFVKHMTSPSSTRILFYG